MYIFWEGWRCWLNVCRWQELAIIYNPLRRQMTTRTPRFGKNSRGQSQSLIMPLVLNPNRESFKKMQWRDVRFIWPRKYCWEKRFSYICLLFPWLVLQSSKAKAIIGRHPLISGITMSIICLPTYSRSLLCAPRGEWHCFNSKGHAPRF